MVGGFIQDGFTVEGVLVWAAGAPASLADASWQPAQVGVAGLSRLDADPAVVLTPILSASGTP